MNAVVDQRVAVQVAHASHDARERKLAFVLVGFWKRGSNANVSTQGIDKGPVVLLDDTIVQCRQERFSAQTAIEERVEQIIFLVQFVLCYGSPAYRVGANTLYDAQALAAHPYATVAYAPVKIDPKPPNKQ